MTLLDGAAARAPLTDTPSGPRRDPSAPAIRSRGLRRTYGHGASAYEAVRGVDLDVPAGSITALLGTNGAGKTSTLEVIEGLAPATDGEVSVLGLDPIADRAALRRRTGVLLQRSGFSGDLTVRETLRLWSATLTAPRPVDDMLALLSLEQRADVRMLALSGGETRRVDLACTLMGSPELVILDEPTTGLDPESRREVWRLVSDLRDGGATVLITTHYLEEAETLADRLEIMHAGRIVRSGTPTEIAAGHPSTISFAGVPERARRTSPASAASSTSTGARPWRPTRCSARCPTCWPGPRTTRSQLDDLDARSPSLETRVPLDRRRSRPPTPSRPSPPRKEPSMTTATSPIALSLRRTASLTRWNAVLLSRNRLAFVYAVVMPLLPLAAAVHRRARRPVRGRGRHRHHVPRHRAVPRLLQRALPVREPPRRARAQAHADRRDTRRRAARQHRAARGDERACAERARHPDRRRPRPAAAGEPDALRGAGGAGGRHVHRVRLLDRGVDPERRGRPADQPADHHPGLRSGR